eukprot:gene28344-37276_t
MQKHSVASFHHHVAASPIVLSTVLRNSSSVLVPKVLLKEEFLNMINKHLEKLQHAVIEKTKSWFNSNRESLQNILNKILLKHCNGSGEISSLSLEIFSEGTKEGLMKLQHLLRLDPSHIFDDPSLLMDIYNVKKAIQSMRVEMASVKKPQPNSSAPMNDISNDSSDEDSFLYLFLCELTCVIQVSIKAAQHNLADKLQPELNRLLEVLRQWFDEQPANNRKSQAAVIVQLVTAACDYEDGTVSPYHSLEELLLLLLPVAEDLKAVERSLLSKRRREESEESASWNKIVRKRTEIERNISGNRGFIPTECPRVDYVSVWKDVSDSFDKENGNMCSYPYIDFRNGNT